MFMANFPLLKCYYRGQQKNADVNVNQLRLEIRCYLCERVNNFRQLLFLFEVHCFSLSLKYSPPFDGLRRLDMKSWRPFLTR